MQGPYRSIAYLAWAISLLAWGCARIDVIEPNDLQFLEGREPVAHVYATNWGWYLFKVIPIATGNLDNPGWPRLPLFFEDNVRIDRLVKKVSDEARNRGANVISDLRVRDRSYYMFWTLFFWLNEYEVSANTSRTE